LRPFLLDVNVLLALAWPSQVHHGLARQWFRESRTLGFRTCPFTEAGFIRISSNRSVIKEAVSPAEAAGLLTRITSFPEHRFWAADLSLSDVIRRGPPLLGYRQIMDAYLIALAAEHGGTLATLDRGAAALVPDPDLVELVQESKRGY